MEPYSIRFRLEDLVKYPSKRWNYSEILANNKEINLKWLQDNFDKIYFYRMTYVYNIKDINSLNEDDYFEDKNDIDTIWIKKYAKTDNRCLDLVFYYLGKNENLDLDIYFHYKNMNWDWKTLSYNPKLNSSMILENIDKIWDWLYLSDKSCVTLDVVKKCNCPRLFSYLGKHCKNKLHNNPNFEYHSWIPILEDKYKQFHMEGIPNQQKKYITDNYNKLYGSTGIKTF